MKKHLILIISFLAFVNGLYATGAATGAVDMREARINVSVSDTISKSYKVECFSQSKPDVKFAGYIARAPQPLNANTMEVVFENLSPNTLYSYDIYVPANVKIASGNFKTKPDFKDRTPPPDFSFTVIGANHLNDKEFDPPFRTPGGEYEIFDAVKSSNPAFVIWADGLNAMRNADIGSQSGINLRYKVAREDKNFNTLLSNQANYGVASAATFGKGADASSPSIKFARDCFANFWANPPSIVEGANAYTFDYSDAQFFVLDDCSQRSMLDYAKDKPKMLGQVQVRWLKNALETSKAKFKIIVLNSPFSNPAKSPDNFISSAEERKEIIDFLVTKKIGGVIFISANKPYGEVSRMVRAGAYPLFDFTAGPTTARVSEDTNELNYFRVPSSAITKRSFLQIKIDGNENARALTATYFDAKGKQLFSTQVKEGELYSFE